MIFNITPYKNIMSGEKDLKTQKEVIMNDLFEIKNSVLLAVNDKNISNVIIPKGVTKIYKEAFSRCRELESVTIPEGVTEIGKCAFYKCTNLKTVTIPEGVTEIRESAFDSCESLEFVNIPEGVTKIGPFAFYKCKSLKTVTIPEGVTEICIHAFDGCIELEKIKIPVSVTYLDHNAFDMCTEQLIMKKHPHTTIITNIHDLKMYRENNTIKILKEEFIKDNNEDVIKITYTNK